LEDGGALSSKNEVWRGGGRGDRGGVRVELERANLSAAHTNSNKQVIYTVRVTNYQWIKHKKHRRDCEKNWILLVHLAPVKPYNPFGLPQLCFNAIAVAAPKRPRTCGNINPLTPKDPYSGRTALLTSKRCILYIYSTNTGTEYFKHGIYCPFFSSKCSLFHNSNVFGSCFIHILYTGCAKI